MKQSDIRGLLEAAFARLDERVDLGMRYRNCPLPSRHWDVALGFSNWGSKGERHMDGCERCRRTFETIRERVDAGRLVMALERRGDVFGWHYRELERLAGAGDPGARHQYERVRRRLQAAFASFRMRSAPLNFSFEAAAVSVRHVTSDLFMTERTESLPFEAIERGPLIDAAGAFILRLRSLPSSWCGHTLHCRIEIEEGLALRFETTISLRPGSALPRAAFSVPELPHVQRTIRIPFEAVTLYLEPAAAETETESKNGKDL